MTIKPTSKLPTGWVFKQSCFARRPSSDGDLRLMGFFLPVETAVVSPGHCATGPTTGTASGIGWIQVNWYRYWVTIAVGIGY
jgi:hypothetical protein